MKKNSQSLLISLITLIPFFVGCTSAVTPLPSTATNQPTTEIPTLIQESTITNTPDPTATPIPTETPPLPCTITFDTNRDDNYEIYRMAPDGSDSINLTKNPGDDSNPTWSPDGSQIAFTSNRENEKEGGQFIYVMNADGTNVRQLTLENESKWPDWSPDGKQITYSHKGDIYTIKSDGSGQSVNMTNSPEEDVQSTFSPDSSKIAWLSGNDGKWNVFVMNSDGTNSVKITDNSRVFVVKWTIDGRILTEWGWKDQQEFCHNCVVDADGSNIIDAGGKGEVERYQPFWTLNGDMVGVANVDMFTGDNEIYLVGKIFPDPKGLGAGFVNLTNNPADDRNPDWPAKCGPGTKVQIVDLKKPKTPDQIVLGYAGDSQEQWQRKNNFKKACDELGIQCIYGDLAELIEQGVDAVVQNSNPSTVDSLSPLINQAQEKGIPVFVLDAESGAEGAYNITIDHDKLVNTPLEWMFESIGGEGDFAYFDSHPEKNHSAIIEKMLAKYPGIHVVTKDSSKYSFSVRVSNLNVLMEDYPGLKAIWANDSVSNIVLEMQGIDIAIGKRPLLMCEPTKEGLFIWKDRLEIIPDLQCITVSNPPGIAYDAVHAAFYLVNGAQIDEAALGGEHGNTFYVDIPVVTNDNLLKTIDIINFEDDQFVVDELINPKTIRERWFLE